MSRLASRLTATAVATGALLAAAVIPAAAADYGRSSHHYPERAQVALGSVHHGTFGRDYRGNTSLNNEWISVVNTGRHGVNLSGWTLSDQDRHTYRFSRLLLAAHASVRVHTGYGHNTRADVYQDRHTSVWQRDDTATLRDSHGRIVDTESWGYRDDRGHHGNGDPRDNRDHHGKGDPRDSHGKDDHGKGDPRDSHGKDDHGKGDPRDNHGKDDHGKGDPRDNHGKDNHDGRNGHDSRNYGVPQH